MAEPALVDLFIGVVGLMSLIISFITMETFRLRNWRNASAFFNFSLLAYTLLKFLQYFFQITDGLLLLRVVLEVGFLLLLLAGLYEMRETAKTIGA